MAEEVTVSVAIADMPEFREAITEAKELVRDLQMEVMRLRREVARARKESPTHPEEPR